MAPFRPAPGLLDTIPGINRATAEVITAETSDDMNWFTSAGHLASWAGVCPGNPYLKECSGSGHSGRPEPKTPTCRPITCG
ncbi:transposase [Streptomyces sp. NPDC002845]